MTRFAAGARLDIMDAAFHYASTTTSRDQYVVLVFGWAGAPSTFEEVSNQVAERADRIADLNKRIREVPGNVDYPRWVRDDAPKAERIFELPSQSWQDTQRAIGALVQKSVDATEAAWRVHVARVVHDVPHADGPAAVVVFQVSHALADGRGASSLARRLFAPTVPAPEPAPTAGPRSLVPAAVGALLALPAKLAASRLSALRARRAYVRAQGEAPTRRDSPRPAIVGNADPTSGRVVHVVACPPATFRRSRFSVTTLALTAVAVATERFLAESGEPVPVTLNALVPMALPPDVEWPAANRIVNGTVDLNVGTADLDGRATAIRASLGEARRNVVDPLVLRWITAENKIPAPVFLAARRYQRLAATRNQRRRAAPNHSVPAAVLANLTVISVDRGAADLTLCGARALFTAGFPMLGDARSVSHGFYGLGETLTVCVIACPETFPKHARYAEIVEQAVSDVAATLATRP